jgi:two-component system response regulator RegA
MGGRESVRSVLVIDDDESWCKEFARQFVREGVAEVSIARDCDEAMALVVSERPDMATVDLCIGRRGLESGFDLIPRLKAVSPSTRVVVVTDYWSVSTYEFTLSLGADAFAGKPTTADAILRLIARGAMPASRPQARFASLEQVEREHVLRTLIACHGNKTLTARVLEIDRRSLQRILKKTPPRR